jgi:dihydropteroate synthase
MHMQGEPRTMQQAPQYGDVVAEVRAFLQERLDALLVAGVEPGRIALDPGFGFGKTAAQNYLLLNRLAELHIGRHPLLLGLSRKSMLGHVIGRQPAERLAGSIAAALAAVARGAGILRVHDVAATADAIKIWNAVELGVSS